MRQPAAAPQKVQQPSGSAAFEKVGNSRSAASQLPPAPKPRTRKYGKALTHGAKDSTTPGHGGSQSLRRLGSNGSRGRTRAAAAVADQKQTETAMSTTNNSSTSKGRTRQGQKVCPGRVSLSVWALRGAQTHQTQKDQQKDRSNLGVRKKALRSPRKTKPPKTTKSGSHKKHSSHSTLPPLAPPTTPGVTEWRKQNMERGNLC